MGPRKFSRISLQMEAFISCHSRAFKVELDNLSLNGMFIRSGEQLSVADDVQITLYLKGPESRLDVSICIQGRVVRSVEGQVAIQFLNMDLDSYTQLRNIMSYNAVDSDRIIAEFINSLIPSDDWLRTAI